MRLACRIGLANFSTDVQTFDSVNALVVERYDRSLGRRIHQEDFNQILGAHGNQKYQELGGVADLRRVARVLRQHASAADLRSLAHIVVLSVAIGNLDMHAKNISLLHPRAEGVRLAPAYDVVPQAHMPTDGKLALAVNKKYHLAAISRGDLLAELGQWGVRRVPEIVDGTLEQIETAIGSEAPLPGSFEGLQDQLFGFVTNLRAGRTIGTPESA